MSSFPIWQDRNIPWTYGQMIDFIQNQLEIRIERSGDDLLVYFTPFPWGAVSYLEKTFSRKTLKDQVIIFPCTTRSRRTRWIQEAKSFIRKPGHARGYSIPLRSCFPIIEGNTHSSRRHWRVLQKTWRSLPCKSAAKGKYIYFDFFKEDYHIWDNKKGRGWRTGIQAQFLSGLEHNNSYMIAIALVSREEPGVTLINKYIKFSDNTIKPKLKNK